MAAWRGRGNEKRSSSDELTPESCGPTWATEGGRTERLKAQIEDAPSAGAEAVAQQTDARRWGREQAARSPAWSEEKWRRIGDILGVELLSVNALSTDDNSAA
jgi:hypothetical protein